MNAGYASCEEESVNILEQQLTDNALYAFMKIIVDIEQSNATGVLNKYAKNPKLLERFPSGFKVRMGFGLHSGWAIEGSCQHVVQHWTLCCSALLQQHPCCFTQARSGLSSRLMRRICRPTSTWRRASRPQPSSME